jgi:hypothetical protein
LQTGISNGGAQAAQGIMALYQNLDEDIKDELLDDSDIRLTMKLIEAFSQF